MLVVDVDRPDPNGCMGPCHGRTPRVLHEI